MKFSLGSEPDWLAFGPPYERDTCHPPTSATWHSSEKTIILAEMDIAPKKKIEERKRDNI
jgi:hypothetical protein